MMVESWGCHGRALGWSWGGCEKQEVLQSYFGKIATVGILLNQYGPFFLQY